MAGKAAADKDATRSDHEASGQDQGAAVVFSLRFQLVSGRLPWTEGSAGAAPSFDGGHRVAAGAAAIERSGVTVNTRAIDPIAVLVDQYESDFSKLLRLVRR